MLEVACISRSRMVAVTEDGQELPITNLFDQFGDDCADVDEAVSCVAGPDRDGLWLSIDFREFEAVPVQ